MIISLKIIINNLFKKTHLKNEIDNKLKKKSKLYI